MTCNRRKFIKHAAVLTAITSASSSLLVGRSVDAASTTSLLNQTLKELFKDSKITESDKIDIQIPLIAENGAVVPITVATSLSNVLNIYILVEKNPLPLSAKFALSEELEPFVSARLKMAETSDIIVVVEANETLYSTKKTVKVTIGGCGG